MYSNPTALQIFGYEKVDLNGKNISIVINHPQHRKNHDQYLENYLRTGRSDVVGQRMQNENITFSFLLVLFLYCFGFSFFFPTFCWNFTHSCFVLFKYENHAISYCPLK